MVEPPRPAHKEMTDPKNRSFLGTFNPQLIAWARRCIVRARELEIPEKEEAVLSFMLDTAGLDGRAREDLRDSLMGSRAPQPALGATQQPNGHDPYAKVPRLA